MKYTLSSIAFFIAAVAFGSLQIPAQEMDLVPHYREGQILHFDFHSEDEISGDSIPAGKLTLPFSQAVSIEIEKVFPSGEVWMILTVKSVTDNSKNIRGGIFTTDELINKPFRVKIDNQGNTVAVEFVGDMTPEMERSFEVFKEAHLKMSKLFPHPYRTVKIGESWDHSISIPSPTPVGEIDQIFEIKFTLDSEVVFQGRKCLLIEIEGNVKGLIGKGDRGTVNGSLKGRRYFDIASGFDIRFELLIESVTNFFQEDSERVFTSKSTIVNEWTGEDTGIR